MIKQKERGFLLTAGESSLLLSITKYGHIVTDYLGEKLPDIEDYAVAKRNYGVGFGTATAYRDQEDPNYILDPLSLDVSLPHRGDYNDPSLLLRREDGQVFDLVYVSSEITEPEEMKGYPTPRDAEQELVIHLKDEKMEAEVELHYLTYRNSDVIGRYLVVNNLSEKPLFIEKAASLQLVLDENEPLEMVSTYGGWAYELNEEVTPISHVRTIIDSLTGSSSCRHNPFFYLKGKKTSLFAGPCYGFNLIYSGNHFEEAELTSYGKIRIQIGISPTLFQEKLAKGESFLTPLAIFAYSGNGINGLTKIMHDFVNDHIVPERFARKERLIDYNSWEGCMFSFNEGKIKSLMKQAKDAGMELFVLDDGWFGKRNDDTSSLGDWTVNKKKLPHGIDGLSEYCHKLGMKFGLWFEPEMISPDSDLYRAHPEYAIQDGIHESTLGRHQLTLDLTKKEVRDYIVSAIGAILKQGVDFVKWDYNRNMSDIPSDPGFLHHYILGLYEVMDELTSSFPEILFLNCASGGNRCDLGMLSYFPLTWVSDDTDAFQRTKMQEAMVVGYPQSVFSNHVSSKTNAQTLRKLAIADKFNAASIGVLGYELDLNDITKHD
ncbi:MAG: alpha-galactosidase, partial [Bacilli bacterium]|nr:alpha-galactosidase [Bacilli bacterium]